MYVKVPLRFFKLVLLRDSGNRHHIFIKIIPQQKGISFFREQYKSVSGGVTERSRLLSQITDDLESVKSEMEERGTSMTDGSPLVNIR